MSISMSRAALSILVVLLAAGCSSDAEPEVPQAFALRFAAMVDGEQVGCSDEPAGFGPSGDDRIGLNDLRFYVSNLRLSDDEGREIGSALDENEFQYVSADGSVALIDLAGNTEGSCSATSVAYAEGTGRTNSAITGTTRVRGVKSLSFDVGVPQKLMKKVIATNTPEGAPSPLNEMYWNWNSGYRHIVFNFSVRDGAGGVGAGYVHIGSRDCAPMGDGIKALEDREACTFVNTPEVAITSFDPERDRIGVDLRRLVEGVDFVSPIYDPDTFDVIGEGPGVECHSSPTQTDCDSIFANVGLDMATGAATSTRDLAFVKIQ